MGIEDQLLLMSEEKRKEEITSLLLKRDIEEDDEEEACSIGLGLGFSPQRQLVVVGYALTSKKIKSFMQPKLEVLAR